MAGNRFNNQSFLEKQKAEQMGKTAALYSSFGYTNQVRGPSGDIIRFEKPSPPAEQGKVGQSFNKMIGGQSGGFSGGLPSMADLEASSMRLADAAAARERSSIQEKGIQERLTQKQQSELQRSSDLEVELRKLERERAEIGSRPYSPSNRNLYVNTGKQIEELKSQIRQQKLNR